MTFSDPESTETGSAIAVIGMACRYPGAAGPAAFWQLLKNGVDAITFFREEALAAAGVDPALIRNPAYVPVGGILSSPTGFDADFFGFSPREAALTDPQHRIFLECAWEALESGGYPSEERAGPVGVFAGSDMSTYFLDRVYPYISGSGTSAAYGAIVGNDKDFLPTLVSYKLNLKGPSLCVQTACSSSLVAVHLACQSLLGGECDLALAGGVGISYPQEKGYLYEPGMILSPDGVCRPFDADARGTVPGNGCGVVLLKRLEEALAAGDTVLAVIRGSAINNDGALKAGFTAPGVAGQAAVIAEAQALAGIPSDRIGYIEAHGTGTELGDPIEIEALSDAFDTDRRGGCPIGSVKGNIGHTGSAAGVAGLIKTILALRQRMIPPSLHFQAPNPRIDFDNSPFFINTALRPWPDDGGPRCAGVSSFGIGGTNAHVVVAEAPPAARERRKPSGRGGSYLLPLSAADGDALEAASSALGDHLTAEPDLPPADVAYTLQVGRKPFSHRRCLVCSDLFEASAGFRGEGGPPLLSGIAGGTTPPLAFMFPGQGAQYAGMGRGLYEGRPTFREALDRCVRIFSEAAGIDLIAALYPADGDLEKAGQRLERTDLAQPAIFAVSYAAARLWLAWGVAPQAMIGHSIGEYVAAVLAGVFGLEEAASLVAERGALMAAQPPGSMLAVMMPETDLAAVLARPDFSGLSLAAVNGPAMCTVSGETDLIRQLESHLSEHAISFRRLRTSHAFHSAMMDGVVDRFTARVGETTRRPPRIPWVSNLTGTWITPEEAVSPAYWGRHLRQPVRFYQGLETLLSEPARIILEVGPGRTLSTFAQGAAKGRRNTILNTLRHPRETISDADGLLTALGRMWTGGIVPDWDRVNGDDGGRVPLPTYPFRRKPYAVEGSGKRTVEATPPEDVAGKRDIADWFYLPSWKRAPLLPAAVPEPETETPSGPWLLFEDATGLGREVAGILAAAGEKVVRVAAGSGFAPLDADRFMLDPGNPEDYDRLWSAITADGPAPDRIIHLGSVGSEDGTVTGFQSLSFLARATAGAALGTPVSIAFVSAGLYDVTGDEPLGPAETALAVGPLRVIPQEYPHIRCRIIDMPAPAEPGGEAGTREWLARRLAAELRERPPFPVPVVALRGRSRWVRVFEPFPIPPAGEPLRLRAGGVYFITGGMGEIGLRLADHLTHALGARVALMGRSPFPEPAQWAAWTARHGTADPLSRKIAVLERIRERGGEVFILQGDVASKEETAAALDRTEDRFGPVNGVIHAAGATGMAAVAPIHDLTPADREIHFGPKVQGVRVLADLLRERRPDFCLLFSSLSSVLGGVGFCAYAAANRYMDAFAQRQNRTSPFPWISVNWDGWAIGEAPGTAGAAAEELLIGPEEGISAFDRLLSVEGLDHAVISTTDLDARLRQWVSARPPEPPGTPEVRHDRPALAAPYQAPRTDAERLMTDIFGELLGIGEIGVDDNFFDLGGHSLLAAQVISRIQSTFGVALPIKVLFENPTPAALADAAALRHLEEGEDADTASLLERLEEMDEETAARLLSEMEKKDDP